MRYTLSLSLIFLAAKARASPHGTLHLRQDSVPSVDLGYEIHTATENVREHPLNYEKSVSKGSTY